MRSGSPAIPGVSMARKKWGSLPKIMVGHGPIVKGSEGAPLSQQAPELLIRLAMRYMGVEARMVVTSKVSKW